MSLVENILANWNADMLKLQAEIDAIRKEGYSCE